MMIVWVISSITIQLTFMLKFDIRDFKLTFTVEFNELVCLLTPLISTGWRSGFKFNVLQCMPLWYNCLHYPQSSSALALNGRPLASHKIRTKVPMSVFLRMFMFELAVKQVASGTIQVQVLITKFLLKSNPKKSKSFQMTYK